jgi:hypothetical protein
VTTIRGNMTNGRRIRTLVAGTVAAVLSIGLAGPSLASTPRVVTPPLTLVFTSDPEGLGQGIHRFFDSSVDAVSATDLSASRVVVSASDPSEQGLPWTLTLTAPSGQALRQGTYGALDDVGAPGAADLQFQGNGRGCDGGGSFTVQDIAVQGTTVTRLDVVFEHHCGPDVPATFGELRIAEPEPAGATLPWRTVAFPATPVGTSPSTALVDVESTGTGTTTAAYALTGPDSADFVLNRGTCGDHLSAGARCAVQVTFTSSRVGAEAATVSVHVGSTQTLITLLGGTGFGSTVLEYDSHSGDYVGGGSGDHEYSQPNSYIQFAGGPSGVVGQVFGVGGPWDFTISTSSGTLEPGTYPASSAVGFSFNGEGRGCGGMITPDSVVVIRQVQVTAIAHRVVRFDASFSQTCEGSTGALTGRIDYNATPSTEQVLAPTRVLDTRSHLGTTGGAIPAHGAITVSLAGQPALDVPGVTSATLNLTVVNPTAAGYLAAETGASVAGGSSSVNFSAGQTVANLTSVPLGPSQTITLRNYSGAPVNVAADLQAISVASISDASGAVVPLPATRVRQSATGPSPEPVAMSAHGTTTVNLSRYAEGAATGISAALVNLTVVHAATGGYLAVAADGQPLRATSAMNFPAVNAASNLAIVPVGPDGSIKIYNGSGGSIQLIVDVQAYYSLGSKPASTGSVVAGSAARLVDTRIGLGVPRGALGPGRSIVFGLVEPSAQGALLTLTITRPAAGGYLSLAIAGSSTAASTSVLNFSAGQTRANLTVTGLGPSGLTITNHSAGAVDVIVDFNAFIS